MTKSKLEYPVPKSRQALLKGQYVKLDDLPLTLEPIKETKRKLRRKPRRFNILRNKK